jgi:multidrug efflux pump subunit AcrB
MNRAGFVLSFTSGAFFATALLAFYKHGFTYDSVSMFALSVVTGYAGLRD